MTPLVVAAAADPLLSKHIEKVPLERFKLALFQHGFAVAPGSRLHKLVLHTKIGVQ